MLTHLLRSAIAHITPILLTLILCSLSVVVRAEEESIMEKAEVSSQYIKADGHPKQLLVSNSYKLPVEVTDNSRPDGSEEISVHLKEKSNILTVFIATSNRLKENMQVIGPASILIGDDTSYMSSSLETVYSPFFAAGFHKLEEPYPGKVISVRRTGEPSVEG